jgi:hypothetical protein
MVDERSSANINVCEGYISDDRELGVVSTVSNGGDSFDTAARMTFEGVLEDAGDSVVAADAASDQERRHAADTLGGGIMLVLKELSNSCQRGSATQGRKQWIVKVPQRVTPAAHDRLVVALLRQDEIASYCRKSRQ